MRRRIDPHGIVLKAGVWYVMARSRRTMRTYRVNQTRSQRRSSEPTRTRATHCTHHHRTRQPLHVVTPAGRPVDLEEEFIGIHHHQFSPGS